MSTIDVKYIVCSVMFIIVIGIIPQASAIIPDWIKTSASFWVDGHVSDKEFISSIEFLSNNNIITVPHTYTNSISSDGIPHWVKNSISYWINDQTNDDEFINTVQYLVKTGIINLDSHNIKSEPNIKETITRIQTSPIPFTQKQNSEKQFPNNTQSSFTMYISENWSENKSNQHNKNEIEYSLIESNMGGSNYIANIMVNVFDLEPITYNNESTKISSDILEEYKMNSITNIRKDVEKQNGIMFLMSEDTFKINGKHALLIESLHNYKDNDDDKRMKQIITMHNNKLYDIKYIGTVISYERFLGQFDNAIQSFKFTSDDVQLSEQPLDTKNDASIVRDFDGKGYSVTSPSGWTRDYGWSEPLWIIPPGAESLEKATITISVWNPEVFRPLHNTKHLTLNDLVDELHRTYKLELHHYKLLTQENTRLDDEYARLALTDETNYLGDSLTCVSILSLHNDDFYDIKYCASSKYNFVTYVGDYEKFILSFKFTDTTK